MITFLVCIKIFFGRLLDVSIGTIRTIFSVKGKRLIAAFLAFFEVLIWYYVARSALNTTLTSVLVPISYSLGYATGTYIGTYLSQVIIKGNTSVQIITSKATKENLALIRKSGFAVTTIDVYDSYDDKKKIFSFLLALALFIPCLFIFSACGKNDGPPPEPEKPNPANYTITDIQNLIHNNLSNGLGNVDIDTALFNVEFAKKSINGRNILGFNTNTNTIKYYYLSELKLITYKSYHLSIRTAMSFYIVFRIN